MCNQTLPTCTHYKLFIRISSLYIVLFRTLLQLPIWLKVLGVLGVLGIFKGFSTLSSLVSLTKDLS